MKKTLIKHSLIYGLFWGILMFVLMELAPPYINHEPYESSRLLKGFATWMIGGLIFGYGDYKINAKYRNNDKGN